MKRSEYEGKLIYYRRARPFHVTLMMQMIAFWVLFGFSASAQESDLRKLTEEYCESLSTGDLRGFFNHQYDFRSRLGSRLEDLPKVLHPREEEKLRAEYTDRLSETIGIIVSQRGIRWFTRGTHLFDYIYEPHSDLEYEVLDIGSKGESIFVKVVYPNESNAPWHEAQARRVSEVILKVSKAPAIMWGGASSAAGTFDHHAKVVPDTLRFYAVPDFPSEDEHFALVERTIPSRPALLSLRNPPWKPISESTSALDDLREILKKHGVRFEVERETRNDGSVRDIYSRVTIPNNWAGPPDRLAFAVGSPGPAVLKVVAKRPEYTYSDRYRTYTWWQFRRNPTEFGNLLASLHGEAQALFYEWIADRMDSRESEALASIGISNEPYVYFVHTTFEGPKGWVIQSVQLDRLDRIESKYILFEN